MDGNLSVQPPLNKLLLDENDQGQAITEKNWGEHSQGMMQRVDESKQILCRPNSPKVTTTNVQIHKNQSLTNIYWNVVPLSHENENKEHQLS